MGPWELWGEGNETSELLLLTSFLHSSPLLEPALFQQSPALQTTEEQRG